MEYKGREIQLEQICQMIDWLDPCMNNCLYVYDLENDYYYISPKAVNRYAITENHFHDVVANHDHFVYPPDAGKLRAELSEILAGKKQSHNLEYRWMDKSGRPVWINVRGNLISSGGRVVGMIGCINEIGVKPKADNLSGLLGEAGLGMFLEGFAADIPEGFFMRVGIDDFKEVNEKHGMEYGDMVLQHMADCLAGCILPGQMLYRVVADEFVILDISGADKEQAVTQYRRIRQAVDEYVKENRYEVVFTMSAGIIEQGGMAECSYAALMKLSEFALNEAKRRGRNRCYIFKQEDYDQFLRKKELAKELRKAVAHGFEGFEAYFQPLFLCEQNQIYGAEALMRYQSKKWGTVSPGEFIPILEETGLIVPAGRWMLHEALDACQKIRRWIPDFRVSINISYIQVIKSDILNEIVSAVEERGIAPSNVMVELTESGMLESDSRFHKLWSKLKDYGIWLALDDFGTGYSNFHYLYELRPDIIKIDRSFTAKAMENDYEYNLLSLMSGMVHNLDLKVCVEGIETEEERQRILTLSPDYSQGFYFGRPCPYGQFVEQFIEQAG